MSTRHATLVAYAALAVSVLGAGGGAAYAATGGTFLLGKANSAGTVTGLSDSAGPALALKSKAGTPPLTVGSSAKVTNLNADLLDGLNASSFRRAGAAVIQVTANLSFAAQPYPAIAVDGGAATCPAGTSVVSMGYAPYSSWAIRSTGIDVTKNRAWVRLDHSKPSDPNVSAGVVRAYCLK